MPYSSPPTEPRDGSALPESAATRELPETIGPYRIVRRLGGGGMGVVYEGFHPLLQRKAAIKVIRPHAGEDRDALARFERELAAMGRLAHPHIVQAFDAGEDRGRPFLVMELVSGCNAEQLVQKLGPLPIAEACELVRQAADGLRHAHQQGLIHRDVKPSNLLLSEQGLVKLADLGLARPLDESQLAQLTSAGNVLGTVDYMAPEQARGEREVEPPADVYSLGCTLFRLLTGCVPFHAQQYDSLLKKLLAHLHDQPPAAAALRPEAPAGLSDLIAGMLAKSPAERPALAEVVRTLAQFSKGACLAPLVASAGASAHTAPPAGRISTISETITYPAPQAPQPLAAPRAAQAGAAPNQAPQPVAANTAMWPRLVLAACGLAGVGWLCWMMVSAVVGGGWFEGAPDLGASQPTAQPPQPSTVGDAAGAADRPAAAPGPALVVASATPPPAPIFEELAPAAVVLNRRYPLLNRPPLPFTWSEHPLAVQSYQPELRQLRVSHPQLAMFHLGELRPAEFVLEINLYQNRWSGGFGVYWGLQRVAGAPSETWTAQALRFLEQPRPPPQEPGLMVTRDKLTLTRRDDGTFRSLQRCFAGVPSERPLNRVQTLQLCVGGTGLNEVRWAGDEPAFRTLCLPEHNQSFSPRDYGGPFGVFTDKCDLVVESASVLVTRWCSTGE